MKDQLMMEMKQVLNEVNEVNKDGTDRLTEWLPVRTGLLAFQSDSQVSLLYFLAHVNLLLHH